MFLVLGLLLQWATLDAFFVSDDFCFLQAVRDGGFSAVWLQGQGGFLRPFVALAFLADHTLYGLEPWGYHVTNVATHAINAGLTALLVSTLLCSRGLSVGKAHRLGWIGGLLFLVLPCHVETVTWISGRTDLLATFFCLLSLQAYVYYRTRGRRRVLVASVVFFLFALLSKESALTLPLVLLVFEWFLRARGRRASPAFLLHGGLLGLYALLRFAAIGTFVGGYGSQVHLAFDVRRLLQNAILFPWRTLVPPMNIPESVLLCTVILLLVVCKSIRAKGQRSLRPMLLLACAFYASALPAANLYLSHVDTQNERLLYWPSVFSTLGLVVLIHTLLPERWERRAAVATLLLVYCSLLVSSNARWREAGELSHRLVAELAALDASERLFIINLPDNRNGAYVLRNGLANALELFGRRGRGPKVCPISYYTVPFVDDGVAVTGELPTLDVRLEHPAARFMNANVPLESTFEGEDYRILAFAGNQYRLRLTDVGPLDRIAYYSSGRIRLVRKP